MAPLEARSGETMHPRLRFALRFYTTGLVFLLVVLAVVVALLGPLREAYVAVEATPILRTIITMVIAVALASLAGLATWRRFWPEDESRGPALAGAADEQSTFAPSSKRPALSADPGRAGADLNG